MVEVRAMCRQLKFFYPSVIKACLYGPQIVPSEFHYGGDILQHSKTFNNLEEVHIRSSNGQVCSENEYMRYGYSVNFSLKH